MKKENIVIVISFVVNFILSFIKFIFGLLFKSSALVADGFHSFSDLLTDIIAIVGNKLAAKPADLKHPYGHGRFEYLTSIAIGVFIIVLGFNIIYNSSNGSSSSSSGSVVVIVSIFTIIFKYILSSFLARKGKEYNNSILISSGQESNADVVSSIIVLISGFLSPLGKNYSIFNYADVVAAIIVGLFIIRTGLIILKENISYILGEEEQNANYIKKIKSLLLDESEIKTIDSLVMLKNGPYYKLIGEVSMDPGLTLFKAHSVVENIENQIKHLEPKVKYINIHINPYRNLIDFNLRDFVQTDIEDILKFQDDLAINCNKNNKYKYIDEKYYNNIKIIQLDGKNIGMVNYYLKDKEYILDIIYVISEYRRNGIGHSIIKNLINSKGTRNIKTSVYKTNEKAVMFYKNLGFNIISETKVKYNMLLENDFTSNSCH